MIHELDSLITNTTRSDRDILTVQYPVYALIKLIQTEKIHGKALITQFHLLLQQITFQGEV